jgi:anti-anti-sigma factor
MASGLRIDVVRTGVELRIAGRLDAHSAPAARSGLQAAIEDGVGELMVSVPDLEIWDASGLGVLVGAQRRARQSGRRLCLVNVSARHLRLFRATRLHRLLGVRADPALGTTDLLGRGSTTRQPHELTAPADLTS